MSPKPLSDHGYVVEHDNLGSHEANRHHGQGAVSSRPQPRARTDDRHGTGGVTGAMLADGAKGHPQDLCVATPSDDKEIGVSCGVQEDGGGVSLGHGLLHLDGGVFSDDACDDLGESPPCLGLRIEAGRPGRCASPGGGPRPGHDDGEGRLALRGQGRKPRPRRPARTPNHRPPPRSHELLLEVQSSAPPR